MKRMPIILIIAGLTLAAVGVVMLLSRKPAPEPAPSIVATPAAEPLPAQEAPAQSSVAQTDDNHAKGQQFEEFVVGLLNRKYHHIVDWRSDKMHNGLYAESSMNPDLLVELRLDKGTYPFAIECKWRADFYQGKIDWATPEQIARYQRYAREQKVDVFLALGVGGTPASPEAVYLVPLRCAKYPDLKSDYLAQFRRPDPAAKLYYDATKHTLR